MKKPTINILMATYNGELYLKQQLDSLLAQTYSNWELLIRDDGSTDSTVSIAEDYVKQDKRISLLLNKTPIKGACCNFSSLLTSILQTNPDLEYIMFSDQDDIWKPTKIQRSVDAIREQEQKFCHSPILIYSNLELMDASGKSTPGQLKLKNKIRLNNLMSFNYVYGCTMLFNKQLASKIGSIPFDAENHDYWVALVASIYESAFLNEKLIRYRQHTSNASGNVAGNNSLFSRLNRLVLNPRREVNALQKRLHMLTMFFNKYQDELSLSNKQMLAKYLAAFKKNRASVCYRMLADGMFKKGFFQSLASFYQVIFFYNKIKAKKHF